MQALSITKLGADKRGTPRIWLEGRKLEHAGFKPSARYVVSVDAEKRCITLRLAANGERLVSHKTNGGDAKPVIDLANRQMLHPLKGVEALKVRFSEGVITITPTAAAIRKIERTRRLRNHLDNGEGLTVGSVSTGLGVLAMAIHQGLEAAGLPSELKFAVDISPDYLEQCAKANPAWSSNTIAIEAPMQELAFDTSALLSLPNVDILEAGIPCTAHSLAGRAKKALAKPEDDPKAGHLVAGFLAIAAATNPAVILVENVPQYLSSASFAILSNQIKEWGYNVHTTVLQGKDFGCLEHRDRMAMVAVTEGIDFDIESIVANLDQPMTLEDVLDDIPEDSSLWSTMSYLRDKEVRDTAAGKGFRMQICGPKSTHVGTIGRGYAKCRSTEVKIQHPSDPKLLRQLTPAEHARIKGVPEKMVEGLGVTIAHEMLGQSILARPFRALADHIGNALVAWQHGRRLPKVERSHTVFSPPPITDLPLFA